ncbi:MAG: hypothetical protein ACEPOW_13885 [Bacteroidales bacterium]
MNATENKVGVEVDYGDRSSTIHFGDNKKRTSRAYAERCERLGFFILINPKSKRITVQEKMAIDFHTNLKELLKSLRINSKDIKFSHRNVVTKRFSDGKTEIYHSVSIEVGESKFEAKFDYSAWLHLDLLNIPIRMVNRLY